MRTRRLLTLLVAAQMAIACGSSTKSATDDVAGGKDATTVLDTKLQSDSKGGSDTIGAMDTSGTEDMATSDIDGSDPALCGNGVLDPGEHCDPAISEGKGVCPTSCPSGDPCSQVSLKGSGCQTRCDVSVVSEIGLADGCCPTGATKDSDPDCADLNLCGNGELDPGETCDLKISDGPGRCPTTCDDQNPCTVDVPIGSLCSSKCLHVEITEAKSGDGCCPSGATPETDSDCKTTCGNGILDEGELCDPKIPSGQTGA
ncbi:MAG: hypothetical protein KC609_20405, partial [Myxococcales bacterium]|nr:hypothetical protein [Myxococcales bacterium]